MNVFIELAECVVGSAEVGLPGRYFAVYDVLPGDIMSRKHARLMQLSQRVWAEDDNGYVRFMKNRYEYADKVPVDLKEFFWIKLRSMNV